MGYEKGGAETNILREHITLRMEKRGQNEAELQKCEAQNDTYIGIQIGPPRLSWLIFRKENPMFFILYQLLYTNPFNKKDDRLTVQQLIGQYLILLER